MKRILILRHAKAEAAEARKKDYSRRLVAEGRAAAADMASTLADLNLRPQFVLSSAAPRAAETARLAAPNVAAKKSKHLHAAPPERWMRRLNKLPESVHTVLLVGHNPECEELILALSGRRAHMKKCSLAVLEFKGEWKSVAPAGAKLIRHVHAPSSAAAKPADSTSTPTQPQPPSAVKPPRSAKRARWTDDEAMEVPPQNRELSWLSFNGRVLQEASDPDVPPLDQLMFLGIVSANLDEFFRVRVGALEAALRRVGGKKAAETRDLFAAIDRRASALQRQLEHRALEIRGALARRGVRLLSEEDFTPAEREFCRDYCSGRVRAGMTVLTNLRRSTLSRAILTDNVYLAVTMESGKGKVEHALIRPPSDRVGRFVRMPQSPRRRGVRVAWLDDVIRAALPDIFGHLGFKRFAAHTVKLTRSAELEVDDEFSPRFAERFAGALRGRERGEFVRLIYDRDIPARTLAKLVKRLRLNRHCILSPGGRYHNLRDLRDFPRPPERPELLRPRPDPLPHPVLNSAVSLLDACAARDQLMHFPYHDFSLILKLLREASMDPDVTAIQMTAYRLARKSGVVAALVNALRNGKKVFCMVEPRARFDEEANLRWARVLEEAGASVTHGLAGHKTHAKAILISRKPRRGKARDIAVLGTGNFNEDSARIYSDLAVATADEEIARDVSSFFRVLRDPAKAHRFKRLLVSPRDMRDELILMIRREAENAAAGKPCGIRLKLNNLSDPKLMRELEKAAAAGVPVRMVIRGVLGLDPDRPEWNGNMRAVSVIDSLLEHARVMIFENGGKPRALIGSADWMRRNMERRLEICAPILDRKLLAELAEIMEIQLADNVKARVLNGAQDNRRLSPGGARARRAQAETREYYRRAAAEGK